MMMVYVVWYSMVRFCVVWTFSMDLCGMVPSVVVLSGIVLYGAVLCGMVL